jgi:Domain of unknown function (DUF4516)
MGRGLGFSRGLIAYSCALASILAGGQVAHLILKPDLTLPAATSIDSTTAAELTSKSFTEQQQNNRP